MSTDVDSKQSFEQSQESVAQAAVLLSNKSIIIVKITTRTTILNISSTPFPGAFFWIQTAFCRKASSKRIINHMPLIFKRFSFFIGQENSHDSRIISADFLGSDALGDFFNGKQTFAPPNRFYAVAVGGGDCYIWTCDNFKRNAYQHARRRAILVRPASRHFCNHQCGTSYSVYELRLSRTSAVRTRALHFQLDNAIGGYAVRARGVGCAALDSNRTDKPSAVGVFKAYHDNLHGGDFRRAHGAIKHDSRFDTNRGLCQLAVLAGFEATRSWHVSCLHGDIFRLGDCVRNALANFYIHSCVRRGGVSSPMALHEGLSENANNGFP